MTDAAGFVDPVDEAGGWAEYIVGREHRGPGDTVDAAMHRAAKRHKLPHQVLWRLRYRKPKDMMVQAYKRLEAAYRAELERQEVKLMHELAITQQMRGTHAAHSGAGSETEAVLGARTSAPEASARSSDQDEG